MIRSLVACALCATSTFAQDFNVDVGLNVLHPAPASAYAAAGRPGTWNAITVQASSFALVDLSGAATPARVTSTGGFLNLDFDHPTTNGDDGRLLDDLHDVGGPSSSVTWSFTGLANGSYRVLTYAWAPDNDAFRTRVGVAGSLDALQAVGGAWTGQHALGVTYASHRVRVENGNLTVTATTVTGFGSLNGMQLERENDALAYCSGDGLGTQCPCANTSITGEGCRNSLGLGGKLEALGASRITSDSFVLLGSQMPNSSALYFQGLNQLAGGAGVVFGDGLRCVGGSTIRLKTVTNTAGTSRFPDVGDPTISVRGSIGAPGVRTYQCWYRNTATFCTSDVFNLTNGVQVTWQP